MMATGMSRELLVIWQNHQMFGQMIDRVTVTWLSPTGGQGKLLPEKPIVPAPPQTGLARFFPEY
jgi:hypothetical protein